MLGILQPGFVLHKFQYIGEVEKSCDTAKITEETRLNGGAACLKKWGRGLQCSEMSNFLYYSWNKDPKIYEFKSFLCQTFSSILLLMNFCLFELDVEAAALYYRINRRVIAKIRSFVS
jgi:hypothetical protein